MDHNDEVAEGKHEQRTVQETPLTPKLLLREDLWNRAHQYQIEIKDANREDDEEWGLHNDNVLVDLVYQKEERTWDHYYDPSYCHDLVNFPCPKNAVNLFFAVAIQHLQVDRQRG